MADQLGVTKAAVSIRIRALERMGLCVKVSRIGDRRDYYQLAEDAGLVSIRISLAAMRQTTSFLEEILADFPTAYPEEQRETFETAKRRLVEMKALHDLFLERLDGLDEEWEKGKNPYGEDEGVSPDAGPCFRSAGWREPQSPVLGGIASPLASAE